MVPNMKYVQKEFVYKANIIPNLTMNYIIGVPEDWTPEESLPMIVFLHGAGERGTDVSMIRIYGVPKLLEKGLSVRAVMLAPQLPSEDFVWNGVVDDLMQLIHETAEKYSVDKNRISLTGVSMGGYGTWETGMKYPSEFSALGPICGGGMSWRAAAIKDIPIRAYHGDADDVVPMENTLMMVDSVRRCGNNQVDCVILRGVGHDSWTFAYEHTDLVEWLISQERKK